MLRVLHITRDFPPRCTGGISTAVGGLVHACASAGVSCRVVSLDGWRPHARSGSGGTVESSIEHQDPIEVLRISSSKDLDEASRWGREFRPSVVHVHEAMAWDLANSIATATAAPRLLTLHVAHALQNRLRGIRDPTLSLTAQERAVDEADLVHAPSRAAARAVLGEDAKLDERVRIAALGVCGAIDVPPRQQRRPSSVLWVGRFSDLNGVADLFDVIDRVHARDPAVRFTISGGVPENRRGERRWLRRWHNRRSAAADSVTFTGWLSPAELARHYRTHRALVSTSHFETFGLVVLEAMAHGLPPAAFDIAALVELSRGEESALLCRAGDVASLAEGLSRLLVDSDLWDRLSATAQQVAAQYAWPTRIPDLLNLYRSLL